MGQGDSDWKKFKTAVHSHVKVVLAGGVSRQELANELGVTRQAISSYVLGRTTPKPHIIEKLLSRWPAQLPFRNAVFGAAAFSKGSDDLAASAASMPQQGDLFEVFKSVKPEHLKVEVSAVSKTDLELKVSIKTAG